MNPLSGRHSTVRRLYFQGAASLSKHQLVYARVNVVKKFYHGTISLRLAFSLTLFMFSAGCMAFDGRSALDFIALPLDALKSGERIRVRGTAEDIRRNILENKQCHRLSSTGKRQRNSLYMYI